MNAAQQHGGVVTASRPVNGSGEAASEPQIRFVYQLGRALFANEEATREAVQKQCGVAPEQLSKAQARPLIDGWKQRVDAGEKASGGGRSTDALPVQEPNANPATRPGMGITDPQIKAVYAVGRGRQQMDEAAVNAYTQENFGVPVEGLTKRQASDLIDMWQPKG